MLRYYFRVEDINPIRHGVSILGNESAALVAL